MEHLTYSANNSLVPVSSSLLTTTLQTSVRTSLVYNDTNLIPFHDVGTQPDIIYFLWRFEGKWRQVIVLKL